MGSSTRVIGTKGSKLLNGFARGEPLPGLGSLSATLNNDDLTQTRAEKETVTVQTYANSGATWYTGHEQSSIELPYAQGSSPRVEGPEMPEMTNTVEVPVMVGVVSYPQNAPEEGSLRSNEVNKPLAKGRGRDRVRIPVGDVNNITVGGVNALGPLEARVMEIVWRLDEATVADVHEEMERQDERAGRPRTKYTTVLTTMSRLSTKGYLDQNKAQARYMYTPKVSQEDYENLVVGRVLDALRALHPRAVMHHISAWLVSPTSLASSPEGEEDGEIGGEGEGPAGEGSAETAEAQAQVEAPKPRGRTRKPQHSFALNMA